MLCCDPCFDIKSTVVFYSRSLDEWSISYFSVKRLNSCIQHGKYWALRAPAEAKQSARGCRTIVSAHTFHGPGDAESSWETPPAGSVLAQVIYCLQSRTDERPSA